MKTKKRFMTTKQIVLAAVMTALVIIFQGIASIFPGIGNFSTAMALVPIVIGAALCGPWIGAWLGFVFSMVVLLSGGANGFLAIDFFATIVIVIGKGTLCGFASGLLYKLLSKINDIFAAIAASIICPIVNTGVFILGGITMMTDNLEQLTKGSQSGFGAGVIFFWGLAIGNFLLELSMCAILSPVIVKLLNIRKRMR